MADTKMKKLIIAIPNASFAEGIKKYIEKKEQYKVVEIVVVLEHLVEQLEMLNQENEHIHAIFLSSDISKKLDDKRLEFLSDTLLTIRQRFSQINFVVLVNQKEGHPFLAELVNMGIYNIFTREEGASTFDLPTMLETIETPLPFSEATKFRDVDPTIPWRRLYKGGGTINVNIHKAVGQNHEQPQTHVKEVIKEVVKTEQVVIEKEKWKEKVVEITISKYLALPSKLISVISLYPQVGTTFLIDNLSSFLSEKKIPVGVIESATHESVWFELLDGEKTAPKEWSPWIKQVKEKGYVEKGSEWEKNSVYYVPYGNFDIEDVTQDDALKLLYLTKQLPILFVDISSNIGTAFSEITLKQSDEIWVVFSGDPIQINLKLEKLISYLTNYISNKNIYMIGNKWSQLYDDYLSREIVEERTGLNLISTIPDMTELCSAAMWKGVKAIEIKKGKELLIKPILDLCRRILPEEIIREFSEKSSWLRVFGK
jgi:hypothetical protein